MPTPQPLRPKSLVERLCATFHRRPVTAIPHWDALEPLDPPVIDVDATWQELAAQIDRLAAAGALDDAHGDLVDRLVEPISHRWSLALTYQHQERLRVIDRLTGQGVEHQIRLGHRLDRLRRDYQRYSSLFEATWHTLAGTDAATSGSTSSRTRELPAPLRPTVLPEDVPAVDRAA